MDIEFGGITPIKNDTEVCIEVTIFTDENNVENMSFYLCLPITSESTIADIKRHAKDRMIIEMQQALKWLSQDEV